MKEILAEKKGKSFPLEAENTAHENLENLLIKNSINFSLKAGKASHCRTRKSLEARIGFTLTAGHWSLKKLLAEKMLLSFLEEAKNTSQ